MHADKDETATRAGFTAFGPCEGAALLAATTATRLEVMPEIPTVGEFLPGYEASAWVGFGVPKDTPAAIAHEGFFADSVRPARKLTDFQHMQNVPILCGRTNAHGSARIQHSSPRHPSARTARPSLLGRACPGNQAFQRGAVLLIALLVLVDAGGNCCLLVLQLTRFSVVLVLRNSPPPGNIGPDAFP
jgi:hypothetical protein